ncbi:MAG: ABC transporter ATP-binding protein [Candidatus Omnitrophota bacterium]
MCMLVLENISKRFVKATDKDCKPAYFWALKNMSFSIAQGEIFGIIGRNGAGKTTLLNIIAGITSPTEGQIKLQGKVSSLFNLGTGFQHELSGAENIYLNGAILGMRQTEIQNKYRNIVEFSELDEFINMPLGNYSQGMQLRLGFSIAIHLDFDLLIIDEVLTVGDGAFQDKCFTKLTEFRQQGKTMIITTQSLGLIERLSTKVLLLEQGRNYGYGSPEKVIAAYKKLLNEHRKLSVFQNNDIVKKTMWWSLDKEEWGRRSGTKEVIIKKVKMLNRWGKGVQEIKPNDFLKIKVCFSVKQMIKEPHFGIAVFREDGVYCYGPNTMFDSLMFERLTMGEGWFSLEYKRFILMPGKYYFSVIIWDKKEVLAYDCFKGYFKLEVIGENRDNQLLSLKSRFHDQKFWWIKNNHLSNGFLNHAVLSDKWQKEYNSQQAEIKSVRFLDRQNNFKTEFCTEEKMQIKIDFFIPDMVKNNTLCLWIGIFRDDGIFCHSRYKKVKPTDKSFTLIYPKLLLLPGEYRVSIVIYDKNKDDFLIINHGRYPFRVYFTRPDHGTVYLTHQWRYKLPDSVT